MMWYQIIALLLVIPTTLYYAPALWSKHYELSLANLVVWATTIVVTIAAFVGVEC